MGYRRHTAMEDVLKSRALRDITAHVNFTALAEHGAARGLRIGTASRRWRRRCWRRANPTSSRPLDTRPGERFAPAHATQDAAVRYGRDVPRADAAQTSSLSVGLLLQTGAIEDVNLPPVDGDQPLHAESSEIAGDHFAHRAQAGGKLLMGGREVEFG